MKAWAVATLLVTGMGCATARPKDVRMNEQGIVQAGAEVLRGRAQNVTPEQLASPEFQALVQQMISTMRAAPGVGLAAPQIGVPLRVFVVEDRAEYQATLTPVELAERERVPVPVKVFINPTLTPVGDEKVTFVEGCLSVWGMGALVERWREVELSGLDEHGQPVTWRVKGWPARILQHEFDHLEGTLYVDRMLTRSFSTQAQLKARFSGRPIADIRRELGL